jgi:transmembrane sensor
VTNSDNLETAVPDRIDVAVYDRYLVGVSETGDDAMLQRWATTPQRRRLLDALAERGYSTDTFERTQVAWARLATTMHEQASDAASIPVSPRRDQPVHARSGRTILMFPRSTAASRVRRSMLLATTLAAVAGTMVIRSIDRPSPAPSVQHHTTRDGEQRTVGLPDGSVIHLAPATSVGIQGRTATVDGEAMFSVLHDPTHPFIVRTANTLVTVLGTTFHVRQYGNERQSRVMVENGRVVVQRRNDRGVDATPIVLTGTMAAITTDSTISVLRDTRADEFTDWTKGMLVFDRVPLRDMLADLARAYGTTIRVSDTLLASERMTMQVSVRTQSLARVLELIGTAVNAHHTYDGRAYLLAPGRTSTRNMKRSPFPKPEKEYGR